MLYYAIKFDNNKYLKHFMVECNGITPTELTEDIQEAAYWTDAESALGLAFEYVGASVEPFEKIKKEKTDG